MIMYIYFKKNKTTTMEESCNSELNSRRLLWAWGLRVSSLWLAYLFKCSARNLYHINWGRNFYYHHYSNCREFYFKTVGYLKIFSWWKEQQMIYINFNSFSFILILKCSINECRDFYLFIYFEDKMSDPILN